jgi:hypothetical protein
MTDQDVNDRFGNEETLAGPRGLVRAIAYEYAAFVRVYIKARAFVVLLIAKLAKHLE